ncbi:MAG: hypothetical protein MSS55_04900 [Ruminococcus sp.]|nr:hypothetical protein [Ruminococcus sp.]
MNDIEKKMEALKAEFLGKLEEPKPWKPERGEEYFTIENGVDVVRYIYIGDDIDESCILSGNYFPTRERAEQVAKKIRLLLQLEQLHDQLCPDYEPDWDGTAKFLVAFDHTDGEMQAFFDRSSGESTLVYFRDVVTAMEAADILNAELEESK